MKRITGAIAVSLAGLILLALLFGIRLSVREHSIAVQALIAARDPADCKDPYGFVTRGVRGGMSYAEVAARMNGADSAPGLGKIDRQRSVNIGSVREPYVAIFNFHYTISPPLSERFQHAASIGEIYQVYFDDAEHAVRMVYNRADAGWDHQQIDIDLARQTMSEPLRLDWQR
jgi:hypothetical protein